MSFRLAAAAAAFLLSPAGAFAHAMLQSAIPPVGATVPQAPAALMLSFSEALEPRFCNVTVTGAAGDRVDGGTLRSVPGNPAELTVPLKTLPPGVYTVAWRAVSVDTHRTQGSYHFKVGK